MDFFSIALHDLKVDGLIHLAGDGDRSDEEWKVEIRSSLTQGFEGARAALRLELEYLRRWQIFGLVAALLGVVLLCAGIVLGYAGSGGIGTVSLVAGILIEALPVLIFRQIEQTRRSIERLVPQYRDLFAVSSVVDYEKDTPTLRGRLEEATSSDLTPSG